METNGVRLTPEQAHAALADTEHVRASAAALSATPWPNWFFITLTLYIAALPITFGGFAADPEWLLPRSAWAAIIVTSAAVYLALFVVAGNAWRAKTGVALRLDVLPKRATVPLSIGLPVLPMGAGFVFRATGQPVWLFAASLIGVAVSVGFHLAFVRLHRKTS
ncbi:hypothetical protein ACQEVY_22045 [Streptomyces sp. CA-288835]|uniref:hypothetical protein n=1 Tax=Streptomyces sp. CA-288835 TaxID=3240069 RepID=UPI003D916F32